MKTENPLNRPPANGPRTAQAGFTLVELMVASTVGVALAAAAMAITFRQRSFHEAHRTTNEIRQNTSFIMQSVVRDLRMAGYGLEVPAFELAGWINWESSFTENPKIIDGANGAPDEVAIAAAFDRPVATLINSASKGDSSLKVKLQVPDKTNPFDLPQNRVVYLGKVETVRITGRSGTATNITLEVSSDPTQLEGIRYDYPSGTAIELVKVVKYKWVSASDGGTGYPYVNRWDTSVNGYGGLWEVSSPYIEDFQIQPDGDGYTVSVTGMAANPELRYSDPVRGDGYRRLTLASSVIPRN